MPFKLVISKRLSFSTAWPDQTGGWGGRNWVVFVGLTGEINQDTGMIMELSQLKSMISNSLLPLVDHWDLSEKWARHPTLIEWGQWWWEHVSKNVSQGGLHHIYLDSGLEGVMVTQGGANPFVWGCHYIKTPIVPVLVRSRLPWGIDSPFPIQGELRDWAREGALLTEYGRVESGEWAWEWQNGRLYTEVWGQCSAGHQLYRMEWSETQNQAVFGKCVRRHGHTFALGVTVPIDGEVPFVWQETEWIGGLTKGGMTLEQLAVAIMNRYDTIVRLRIHETEGNRVSIRRVGLN